MTIAAAVGFAIFFGAIMGIFIYDIGANDDDY